jgi:uncharacterized pyridoxal phosphate-containing UPF0001 family protein
MRLIAITKQLSVEKMQEAYVAGIINFEENPIQKAFTQRNTCKKKRISVGLFYIGVHVADETKVAREGSSRQSLAI